MEEFFKVLQILNGQGETNVAVVAIYCLVVGAVGGCLLATAWQKRRVEHAQLDVINAKNDLSRQQKRNQELKEENSHLIREATAAKGQFALAERRFQCEIQSVTSERDHWHSELQMTIGSGGVIDSRLFFGDRVKLFVVNRFDEAVQITGDIKRIGVPVGAESKQRVEISISGTKQRRPLGG